MNTYTAVFTRQISNSGIKDFRQVLQKAVLVFVFGSVVGFAAETIFYLITESQFLWRGSLFILPFNVIYGVGALMFWGIAPRTAKPNLLNLFIRGAVAGTIAEYLFAVVQEAAFGSVSWDYSMYPFNIGGRICLLFTAFWGLLAVLWVKSVQPLLEHIIAKIPNKIMKPLTIVTVIVIIVFAICALLAVARYGARMNGVPGANGLSALLDKVFSDDVMGFFYSNMEFSKIAA